MLFLFIKIIIIINLLCKFNIIVCQFNLNKIKKNNKCYVYFSNQNIKNVFFKIKFYLEKYCFTK